MGILGLATSIHYFLDLHIMVGGTSRFSTERETMLVGTLGAMGKLQFFSKTGFVGER